MHAFGDERLARRFNEISIKFAERMADDEMNTLLAEQADLQEKIDAGKAGRSSAGGIALDALRCPPFESAVNTSRAVSAVVWRCAACC